MTRRRKTTRPRSRKRTSYDQCEWIGGRLSLPFFIDDASEPYRPDLIVWLEQPSGLVVGQGLVVDQADEQALVRELFAAMDQPAAGAPRQPDAIRVADVAQAAVLRTALDNEIPITVAPTPELDALRKLMLETMPEPEEDAEESYLARGRISPDAVARFFAASELLYGIAPWKVATDDQVLRMDIPALDVNGACVCIIGNLGESLGVLIFPSAVNYDAFLVATDEQMERGHVGPIDFGTEWLALSFERGAELTATMRREVATHGWPVADAEAYPVATHHERDGVVRPPNERVLAITAACATSLCTFFAKHRSLFAGDQDEIEPVCESYVDENDFEVRFTLPYEAAALFELASDDDVDHGFNQAPMRAEPLSQARVHSGPKPSRNAPCPCGSGRKYKKCCLDKNPQASPRQRESRASRDLDGRLVRELSSYALSRFGPRWLRSADDFEDVEAVLQLTVPWSVFHIRVEGRTAYEAYLEEGVRRLTRAERSWLDAQQAAWLSLWEVTDVEPGVSLTLRDLLTHETRCVREATGSRTVKPRSVILARIVDHGDESLICGFYPRVLPPAHAAEVERRARGRLRRKSAVPAERLRDEAFGRYLIKRWEEVVRDMDAAYADPRAALPELQNTDGDPLLLTTDHFAIAPRAQAEVATRLAALPDVQPPEAGENPPSYVFLRRGNPLHKQMGNIVIGHARLGRASLQVETNSQNRADALRARIETACGSLLSHRAREHADPLSANAPSRTHAPAAAPPSPEVERLMLEFKQRHYADWPDHPLPALAGKTPREAMRTAQGRSAVDLLLKEMEHQEHQAPSGPAYDFSQLRRQLGIA